MFKFLTFEIQNFQTISDREMTEAKVVVLDDIYNFAIKKLFYFNLFRVPNTYFKI